MEKKAFTSSVNALILVAITILITAVFSYNLFSVLTDTQNREFCVVEGLKSKVGNVKEVSFFKTYEVNCKAQKKLLSFDELNGKIPTKATLDAYGYASDTIDEGPERVLFNSRLHFAKEIASCWERTGNNNIINTKESPTNIKLGVGAVPLIGDFKWAQTLTDNKLVPSVVLGTEERLKAKDKLLLLYLGFDAASVDHIPSIISSLDDAQSAWRDLSGNSVAKIPAVMCMICSTTYFDSDSSESIENTKRSDPLTFTKFLEKTPTSSIDKKSLLSTLRLNKGEFPKYPLSPSSGDSVVYYQYILNGDEDQSIERTGIVVLPQSQVANLCDVIVNQA